MDQRDPIDNGKSSRAKPGKNGPRGYSTEKGYSTRAEDGIFATHRSAGGSSTGCGRCRSRPSRVSEPPRSPAQYRNASGSETLHFRIMPVHSSWPVRGGNIAVLNVFVIVQTAASWAFRSGSRVVLVPFHVRNGCTRNARELRGAFHRNKRRGAPRCRSSQASSTSAAVSKAMRGPNTCRYILLKPRAWEFLRSFIMIA